MIEFSEKCLYYDNKEGENMAKYDALTIAKWFILRDEQEDSEKMTLLKVLKLLYYAEGCFLALGKGSLFSEEIVAWEHGPVVVEVYEHFPDAYNLDIAEKNIDELGIDENDIYILEQVYQVFGAYSAWALRNKTHQETPWLEATKGGIMLRTIIDRDVIEKYFKENYIAE